MPMISTDPILLASGLAFPEGPALSRDGSTLYFVNVLANWVCRYDIPSRTLTREWLMLPAEGRGNGATLGPDGALYIADVGAKRIARIGLDNGLVPGEVTTVASTNHVGGPLLGPNDLIFAPDGSLYFTDPHDSWNDPIGAVYKVHPNGQVSLVAKGLRFPNGLVLSADARTLYVAISPLGRIDAIDLKSGEVRLFAETGEHGGPDGMRFGPDGFLYAAILGDGCIAKISPQGDIVARLPVGGASPTNLCFASDGFGLYVTEAETHSLVFVPLNADGTPAP